jgi:hypothetical protein
MRGTREDSGRLQRGNPTDLVKSRAYGEILARLDPSHDDMWENEKRGLQRRVEIGGGWVALAERFGVSVLAGVPAGGVNDTTRCPASAHVWIHCWHSGTCSLWFLNFHYFRNDNAKDHADQARSWIGK